MKITNQLIFLLCVSASVFGQQDKPVVSVATIADLTASIPVAGKEYQVRNYSSTVLWDSPRTFRNDPTATNAHDGVHYLTNRSIAGRWVSADRFERQQKAEWFGVVADGTSDNIGPLRSAVAHINRIGGGTLQIGNGEVGVGAIHTGPFNGISTIELCSNLKIELSEGTTLKVLGAWSVGKVYAVITTLPSGVYGNVTNVVIDGNGGRILGIRTETANDADVVHGMMFNATDSRNITVRNITIQDCHTGAQINAKDVLFEDVKVDNAENNAVAVTEADNVRFVRCQFTNTRATPGGNAVQAGIDVEPDIGESTVNVSIENCIFDANGKYGLKFHQGAGNATGLTLVNSTFTGNTNIGVQVDGGSDIIITGNKFSGNATAIDANNAQILVSASRVSVSDNDIIGTTGGYGIRIVFSDSWVIANNSITNAGGTFAQSPNNAAVYISGCRPGLFANNTVRNGGEYGLLITSSEGVTVTGNIIAGCNRECVSIDDEVSGLTVSGNTISEAFLSGSGQYVATTTSSETGAILFQNNRFTQSLRYNAGTVAGYSAGTPSITLDVTASSQDDWYIGSYVLVGAQRIAVTDYVGSTRVATLASAYASAPTPSSSTYKIVAATSPNIGIYSQDADNGTITAIGNDFTTSDCGAPYLAAESADLEITWPSGRAVSVTTTYTATLADEIMYVDASAGSLTINLPSATLGRANGKRFTIFRTDWSSNSVTIDGNSTQTIDGSLTAVLPSGRGSITIQGRSDSSWMTVAAFLGGVHLQDPSDSTGWNWNQKNQLSVTGGAVRLYSITNQVYLLANSNSVIAQTLSANPEHYSMRVEATATQTNHALSVGGQTFVTGQGRIGARQEYPQADIVAAGGISAGVNTDPGAGFIQASKGFVVPARSITYSEDMPFRSTGHVIENGVTNLFVHQFSTAVEPSTDFSGASVYLGSFTQRHSGSGWWNFMGGPFMEASVESTGSVGETRALTIRPVTIASSGNVGSAYGLRIRSPTYLSTGVVTNMFGLYIDNQSSASAAYAIYTGAGTNRFGDEVVITTGKGLTIDGVRYTSLAGLGGGGSTNGTDVWIEGVQQGTFNLLDGAEIAGTKTGSNYTYSVVAGSLGTNKLTTAAYTSLVSRATHTGTQTASTISDFTAAAIAAAGLGWQPTNANLTTVASLTGGTSTNFHSGDGSFKQVTTNMVPGLNAALAASEPLNANKYQRTNAALTTLSAATGGNATNFYAGDGTFKQVTTNMIPGLVQALADGVAGGGGGGSGSLVVGTDYGNNVTNVVASASTTPTRTNGTFAINVTSVDDSAIPAGITRDIEAAATYPTLTGNNTLTGANTLSGAVAITGTLSVSNLVATNFFVGSTNVPAKLAELEAAIATAGQDVTVNGSGTLTNIADGADITLATSGGTTATPTLTDTGVTAGTYDTVTVDAKGRVTVGNPWLFYREYEFLTPSASRATVMAPDVAANVIGVGGSANQLTTPVADRPGIFRITSGANANSGYNYLSDPTSIVYGGGEEAEMGFRIPTTNFTAVTFGFFDVVTASAPTDGLVARVGASGSTFGIVEGYAYNNTTPQTSPTSTNLVENTFYRLSLSNSFPSGTLTFRLKDTNNAVLWSSAVTNGFPSGTTRSFGYGFSAWNTNNVGTNVLDIDYAWFGIRRTVNR